MSAIALVFWILLALVFYTYLGYGIVLLVLVRIKRLFVKPKKLMEYEPAVTLVVPCFNEEDFIREKVENCFQLNYPKEKLKLLFITDGSSDGTVEILKSYEGILLLHEDRRAGKAAAENRAMKFVETPIVVFCDANTMLNKDAIRNLARHYQFDEVGGVSGEKRVMPAKGAELSGAGEGLYWKYESTLKKWDSELLTIVGAAGELVSFRTALCEDLEEDSILDDFMQSMRIAAKGYRFLYEPEAYAMESPSANVKEELNRKVRIAAGGWQSMHRLSFLLIPIKRPLLSFIYISHRVLRWSISAFSLPLVFLLNIPLLSVHWIYTILFAFQVFFYFLATIRYIQSLKNKKSSAFYVPYYFSLMNYAVFAGFGRWIKGSQAAAWERSARAKAN